MGLPGGGVVVVVAIVVVGVDSGVVVALDIADCCFCRLELLLNYFLVMDIVGRNTVFIYFFQLLVQSNHWKI